MSMQHTLVTAVVLGAALTVSVSEPGAAQASRSGGAVPAATAIKLYVFDGGTLESDPTRYRLTKQDVGVTELSVAAYLVVHPKGVLMWDAGGVSDEEWAPTGSPVQQRLTLPDGQERRVTLTRPLQAQLLAAGYRPSQITHLALSHYHWDHTANANLFAGATWLVRQQERDAMFAEKLVGAGRPTTYASLRTSRTQIISADEHDVFGDGAVILVAAPGHTPGHQVLYLKLPKTGSVVLSGDLYHYPQERTMDRLPTFEFDQARTRVSRAALDRFLARTKAQLWIQHDFTAHSALRKAPEYYQ